MKTNKVTNRLKEAVKPKSFFVDLADDGILDDFLYVYLDDSYKNDKLFRDEMLKIQFQYSPLPVMDLEILYLQRLSENLKYFLELVNFSRNQKIETN
jgi:hypothetical protein